MPRNWLQWIMANENKEIIKSASTNVNTNDEITSRGVTQDQGGNKYNLIKNDSVDTKIDPHRLRLNTWNGSSDRNSFISVDSGICSDVSDFDFSDEIEEEIVTKKLRKWLEKIKHRKKPPALQYNTKNEVIETSFTKADPYFETKETHWAGGLDNEGRYHGKGILTYFDEGFATGTWSHGLRYSINVNKIENTSDNFKIWKVHNCLPE